MHTYSRNREGMEEGLRTGSRMPGVGSDLCDAKCQIKVPADKASPFEPPRYGASAATWQARGGGTANTAGETRGGGECTDGPGPWSPMLAERLGFQFRSGVLGVGGPPQRLHFQTRW